jgi:hypothetical protein
MVQPASQSSSPLAEPRLFTEAQEPPVTSRLFWARLLTYRSMFLLGGLWFGLICIAAIAYSRLMFTEPPIVSPPAPRPEVVVPPRVVFSDTLPEASDTAEDGLESGSNPDRANNPAPGSQPWGGSLTWGLLSLVGLCAFGCFVIAHQAKAPPKPPRRKKQPVAKKRPQPPAPSQPKRLAPYSPRRDGMVVPGRFVVEAPQAIPQPAVRSRPTPPTPNQPRAAKPAPAPLAPPVAHRAAVVPETEDLPLDWSEESIAHTLDLRQRRSLSSFM